MTDLRLVATAALLALGACSGQNGAKADQAAKAELAGATAPAEVAAKSDPTNGVPAPFTTELPLSEFMPHVMQYAGDGIWKRQGYIVDDKGEHSLFPKNDQEWEDAESASLALAEMTNVLLIPGRRVNERPWDDAVLHVRRVALDAAKAAEKKDADAFFAAGGELDEACDDCHKRYDPKFNTK